MSGKVYGVPPRMGPPRRTDTPGYHTRALAKEAARLQTRRQRLNRIIWAACGAYLANVIMDAMGVL